MWQLSVIEVTLGPYWKSPYIGYIIYPRAVDFFDYRQLPLVKLLKIVSVYENVGKCTSQYLTCEPSVIHVFAKLKCFCSSIHILVYLSFVLLSTLMICNYSLYLSLMDCILLVLRALILISLEHLLTKFWNFLLMLSVHYHLIL